MTQLPLCHWRGIKRFNGRYECHSPKLITPNGVTEDICMNKCYCVNHPPVDIDDDLQIKPHIKPKPAIEPIPCVHLGRKLERVKGSCNCDVFQCSQLGQVTQRPSTLSLPTCYNEFGVQRCPKYDPKVDNFEMGAVIGCYGWPKLTELQVQVIRHMNGTIPILIVDDSSGNTDAFADISSRYWGVSLIVNQSRYGHYSGDARVFYHGLKWALDNGIRKLFKISQRMLVTVPGWMQEWVKEMGDASTLYAPCIDKSVDLYVRTELMCMNVDDWWNKREMFNVRELNNPTELFLNHLTNQVVGKAKQTARLNSDRYISTSGYVFHTTESRTVYEQLAQRYKLSIDDDFSVAGRNQMPGQEWKRG